VIKIISAYKCTLCGSITESDADGHVCSKSLEALKPDVQQLKQAIALVRRSAGLHLSIGEIDLCKGCLDLIEQRACI